MGWLFVPGLADSNSASDSPAPDTDVWVQSSGTPKRRPFSLALKSRSVMSILSGTISRPSRAHTFATRSMSCLLASRASPCPTPESSEAKTTSAGSGPWSPDTFAIFDRASYSWNAPPDMFGTALPIPAETWPSSGSTRSGVCSQTKPAARRIGVSGSSFSRGEYPTPAASRYGKNQGGGAGAGTGEERPSLETWAKQWPTPNTMGGGQTSRGGDRKGELLLGGMAKNWATPISSDGEKRGVIGDAPMSAQSLGRTAQMWPTATATDAKAGGSRNTANSSAHAGVSLTDAVLTGDSSGRRARQTSTAGEITPARVRLSPRFVEALMGLPTGLASCTLSGTRFRQWLQQWRGELLRLERG